MIGEDDNAIAGEMNAIEIKTAATYVRINTLLCPDFAVVENPPSPTALRQCTRFKLLFWRDRRPSRVVSCTEVVLRFSNDWQSFPNSQSNNVCVNIILNLLDFI